MSPNKNSSTKEILAYEPTGWAGSYRWFNEKRKLLEIKKMQGFWKRLLLSSKI